MRLLVRVPRNSVPNFRAFPRESLMSYIEAGEPTERKKHKMDLLHAFVLLLT